VTERTVAIIDDHDSIARGLAAYLADAGFLTSAYSSAEEALDGDAPTASVVISDLKLPGMSGLDLLARIRTGQADKSLFLMSAYFSVEDVIEALRLGVNDVFTKPLDNRLVLERLQEKTRLGISADSSPPPLWRLVREVHPGLSVIHYYAREPAYQLQDVPFQRGDARLLIAIPGYQKDLQGFVSGLLVGLGPGHYTFDNLLAVLHQQGETAPHLTRGLKGVFVIEMTRPGGSLRLGGLGKGGFLKLTREDHTLPVFFDWDAHPGAVPLAPGETALIPTHFEFSSWEGRRASGCPGGMGGIGLSATALETWRQTVFQAGVPGEPLCLIAVSEVPPISTIEISRISLDLDEVFAWVRGVCETLAIHPSATMAVGVALAELCHALVHLDVADSVSVSVAGAMDVPGGVIIDLSGEGVPVLLDTKIRMPEGNDYAFRQALSNAGIDVLDDALEKGQTGVRLMGVCHGN